MHFSPAGQLPLQLGAEFPHVTPEELLELDDELLDEQFAAMHVAHATGSVAQIPTHATHEVTPPLLELDDELDDEQFAAMHTAHATGSVAQIPTHATHEVTLLHLQSRTLLVSQTCPAT